MKNKRIQYIILEKKNIPVLIILIFSIGLRLFHFFDLPYTFDEMSALMRVDYKSFSDLINFGVKGDGHPAGIQIFLYYWVMLFGKAEWIVKLPFMLCGVGSVWIVYLIGKKWFSETSGLLSASCLATLQVFIIPSEIARPYSTGVFFVLMTALCWTKFLFDKNSNKIRNLIGFVIFASLCTYNHYFSFMQAIIIGISGLFFLKRENYYTYLLAGVCVSLFYVPHLTVFLNQIKIGGLEWVGKPEFSFFTQYFEYVFQYDFMVYSAVCSLIIISLFFAFKNKVALNKFSLIALLWFLIPVLTGYYYSVFFKPVLQFSVVVFSLPFLILFLFSFFRETAYLFKLISVGVLVLMISYSLVEHRRHFDILINKQPVIETVEELGLLANEEKTDSISAAGFVDRRMLEFYADKNFLKSHFISFADSVISYTDFRKKMQSCSSNYFLCCLLPFEYLSIVKEYFPFIAMRKNVINGEIYLLSKTENIFGIDDENIFNLFKNYNFWQMDSTRISSENLKKIYKCDSSTYELFPGFAAPLTKLSMNHFSFTDVIIFIHSINLLKNVQIILQVDDNVNSTFWYSLNVESFLADTINGFNFRIYQSQRLNNYFKHDGELKNKMFRVFISNPNKESFGVLKFNVQFRKGNPFVYGLVNDIR